jgi:acyl carrier protein
MSLEVTYKAQETGSDSESQSLQEREVYARLAGIFQEIFDGDIALSPGTTAQDVEGWDSFAHINLVLAVESEFGVRFSSSDVERMVSVGDMVAFIAGRRRERL